MSFFKDIPFRQQFFFPIAVVAGLTISLVAFDNPKEGTLFDVTLFYSFLIPMFLLVFDSLTDLRNTKVFSAWFVLSLVLLSISLLHTNNVGFMVHRNPITITSASIHITNSSASSLKSLFVFLVAYQIINQLFYKPRGEYIINTYKTSKWFHDGAQREVRPYDVLVNIILLIAIAVAVIF